MDEKKSCCNSEAKCIKGVVCDVKSCAYHEGQNMCCAGTISVGPRDANCSANTNCATFKPKA